MRHFILCSVILGLGCVDEDASMPEDENGEVSGDSEGGDEAFAVAGRVSRVDPLDFWDDGDGVGTLYIAAVSECADGAIPTAATAVPDADLSDPSGGADFVLEGVGPGTHFLIAFLDDDLDAPPDAPAPDQGDLVLSDGLGMGCTEVEVEADEVAGLEIALNFVLPF